MSSCCRGKDVDPNIAFFDAIDKATYAINNRSALAFVEDVTSNVRWNKLSNLMKALKNIELLTEKEFN
jgi:hypothetical protein